MDQREYRLFVWAMGATSCVILLPLMLFLLRSEYRHHEEKLHLARARTYLAQGDFPKATLNARQALSFNPLDISACRLLAEIAAVSHSTEELTWQQRIIGIQPTIENKLALAAAGLRCQEAPFLLTSQILDGLATAGADNPKYHMLAATLAIDNGHPEQAEPHLEAAARLDPTNRQYSVSLASFRLNSSNPLEKKAARELLEKLVSDPEFGPASLRALITDRMTEGDVTRASAYSSQLLASSQATFADRLKNLDILKRMNSSSFANQLRSLEMEASSNGTSVAELSDWLQASNLMAEDLDWLSGLPDSIRSKQPVQLTIAQAYMLSGNWQSLLDFIARGNWEDQDFLRLAMLSHAWSEMGEPTVASSNWGEAVRKASSHFEAMTNLMALAQRWQLTREQQDLQVRLGQFAR